MTTMQLLQLLFEPVAQVRPNPTRPYQDSQDKQAE
jgi:hypothetical protein